MLVTNKELQSDATANGYAVGAFNISNLETVLAITEAAVEEKSPAIIAVSASSIKYAGIDFIIAMVKTAAKKVSVPMTLHLDHGADLEICSKCIDAGFTSVMIDGSHLNFEQNISLTKSVVDYAHPMGVSVEAELGRLAGIEDAIDVKETVLTDPDAVKEFVERTGVDALAIAIGTSHGAYKFKAEPKLDFERLKEIRKKTDVLLVLHGASGVPSEIVEKAKKYGAELGKAKGVPDEHIKKVISLGISKVNIDTDLRLAFTATFREIITNSPTVFDPRKFLGPAKEAMKEVIKGKMRLFGSASRAI